MSKNGSPTAGTKGQLKRDKAEDDSAGNVDGQLKQDEGDGEV